MAEAGMVQAQALALNPVAELAEEAAASLPNPDEKKTPGEDKI